MAKVNWFVTQSADHPYGEPREQIFPDGRAAWDFAEGLRQQADVDHVEWKDRLPDRPHGALLAFGWVRDDAGAWREQYREEAGVGYRRTY